MMLNNQQYKEIVTSVDGWIPLMVMAEKSALFSYAQLRLMHNRREEHPHLNKCFRRVGKRILVNDKLFGLWMANELPEQRADMLTETT
ncbi:hypothetical protein FE810_03395 [Thalassotalea litorea]|uniref:Uncharacterized protein n=1 Tax=Thalassotalea litorea TaxID=2020715 RepID=A0A5R9IP97_9GAMM|nr:hypothetical protein [Thalassotalea litorea]TLU67340.1 hypothetical protein FE810_03395 [Thalassotalea litorea]